MPGYDYGMAVGYFVTLCAAERRCVFGKIENGLIRLHPYGRIVEEEWQRTAALRTEVTLDQYVIMPNHFHVIILIRDVGACGGTPSRWSREHHVPQRHEGLFSRHLEIESGQVTFVAHDHHAQTDIARETIKF